MIGESRSAPYGGAMSPGEIERELARLRMNEDGTLGARASVLNLVAVTNEETAPGVTRVVSELSGRYPSRVVLIVSDPDEEEANLEVSLSSFCGLRRGLPGGNQVCAEQIKIHVEGPPAGHLESLAGPLLIPDLPVFLWYPGEFSPRSQEFAAMADLADRIIVDSAAAGDSACLREIAGFLEDPESPAIGDLQWVMLSPWRALVAELFNPPERAEELGKIRKVEVLHTPAGECRALLFVGWFASKLGWRTEDVSRVEEGREVRFAGPSGEIVVELSPNSPDARFRRVRLYSDEHSFQVSRHRNLSDARTTIMRGDELLGELTVRLGGFDLGVILGEELQYRGRDEVYEAALRTAVGILDL